MPASLRNLRHATLNIEDGIAEFTHQRPEARNALSMELRDDYADLLDTVERDRSIRVLIVTGSGGSFCAGGDLKSMTGARERPETGAPEAIRRRVLQAHGWMQRLRNLELPVIAAVDGAAVGAGFSLALAADFVLASSRAFFCMSFAKVGLVPDLGAAWLLPRVIGMSAAKELVLTARKLGAEEAQQLGIVHAIHAPETLADDARAFAQRFVAAPREALGLGKRLLNQSFETPYASLAELECAAQAVASSVPFHAQAIEAFLEGRPPLYDWERQPRA
ncbi:enoyl-CoA hydratase/isomerase family protein [Paraburkholderia sp. Ac-20340]|uniref:enoyl-CoA hydratase/isomerase family protein n=1 Tax=Paraburkholderia sp. Ac-20340 TaxID=2703888 RepID=UPI001980DB80|nr:enoyl-CoA hydratase-related protein [Paraburkholderia sp. Ac-20340]MBN3853721.1 enoyl-CoA hydratase/isomerase family protein [Paraburkholderia sp. Ac-20340]